MFMTIDPVVHTVRLLSQANDIAAKSRAPCAKM
jgi:hypothetical protein